MRPVFPFLLGIAATGLAAGGALAADAPPPSAGMAELVPEIARGFLKGYLTPEQLPDSAALLPPPPPVGSAAQRLDEQVARETLSLRGTPRWTVAALDAALPDGKAADAFSCALGVPINATDTPHTLLLLRRVLTDAGRATGAAKKKYFEARPFMVDYAPICTPDDQERLRQDGSYPSGHTSIGWAWALTLAEAAPDQAQAIVKRGFQFGESRLVCNVGLLINPCRDLSGRWPNDSLPMWWSGGRHAWAQGTRSGRVVHHRLATAASS